MIFAHLGGREGHIHLMVLAFLEAFARGTLA